jgi:hypothetical protein
MKEDCLLASQNVEAESNTSRQTRARRTGLVRRGSGARKVLSFPKSTDCGGNLSNTFLPQREYLGSCRASPVKSAHSTYLGIILIGIRDGGVFL